MTTSSTALKKQLGLYDVFAICTGAMFSSGFFLLPGIAASQTGDSVFLAYFASALLIIPAMLSVAELSTAMPKSGGTYYFLDRSMGPMFGAIGGLGSWVALMFKSAFALIGMGAYLSLFIDVPITALALILTILFGILNIFGAKETTLLQRLLVTVLVIIMTFFIIQGLTALPANSWETLISKEESFFRNEIHGFISTIGLVFVSYAGLTKVTSVAEEVQNPDRNIPLGMILSLSTACIIYVSGVYVMQTVLPQEVFYSSLTPVADAGAQFMTWLPGSTGVILIVIAAVAAFASTGNAGIMSASRYPFAMSRDKLMPSRFSAVNSNGTPSFAIVITVICMLAILLFFNVEAVAKLASAFQLLLFGLICLSVIIMRESRIKGYVPGFKSPLYPWVQIAGLVITVWLIAEMGLLAVSFTGFIIILCVLWYLYYAKHQLERRGAIFHVHQRLGQNRYDALEVELLNVLNEKNKDMHLSYKETIARSIIVDIDEPLEDTEQIFEQASDLLSGRLKIDKKTILEDLNTKYMTRFHTLGNQAICSYFSYDNIESSEMIIFRLNRDSDLNLNGVNRKIQLFVLLFTPVREEGLEIRLIGHLAEIINSEGYKSRISEAKTAKEVRETLLSDDHFTYLKVSEHPVLRPFAGKKLAEVKLPPSCLVAIIYRANNVVIPHGNTEIFAGDELLLIGSVEDIQELNRQAKPV